MPLRAGQLRRYPSQQRSLERSDEEEAAPALSAAARTEKYK
jgi:hypothetical protein